MLFSCKRKYVVSASGTVNARPTAASFCQILSRLRTLSFSSMTTLLSADRPAATEGGDRVRDGIDGQDVLGGAEMHRGPGHTEDQRGGLVLTERHAARVTDREKPASAVLPHARQEGRASPAPVGGSEGLEEPVHRGAWLRARRLDVKAPVRIHGQIVAVRRQV